MVGCGHFYAKPSKIIIIIFIVMTLIIHFLKAVTSLLATPFRRGLQQIRHFSSMNAKLMDKKGGVEIDYMKYIFQQA